MTMHQFKKIFNFTFNSFSKNIKYYIYIFIFPIFIILLLFLISFGIKKGENDTSQLNCFLLIPAVSTLIPISSIYFEWKKTVLIKQLNNFRIKLYNVDLSIYLITLFSCFLSTILSFLWITILMLFFNPNDMYQVLNILKKVGFIFGFLLNFLMTFSFIFAIAKIISILINSIYILQTINIFLTIFFIFFSYIFLSRNTLIPNFLSIIISINPINFFSTLNLYFYFDIFSDKNHIFLIFPDIDQKNLLIKPWILLIFCIFTSSFSFIISWFIKFKHFKR